jgi:hypothetical protein
MKRLFGGSVIFAASLVLVSCTNDPTSDFRGNPARIVADPASIFLDQGENASVIVRLEDDQGNPLAADWQISGTATGITIDRNEDFLGTTVGAPLESEAQFDVFAGNTPVATSFTVSGGGLSLEIPVKVTPTSLASAVFSNATPAVNEVVTVTAEGFTFLPEAAISFGGTPAIILANDGTTLTFLPLPGSAGPALIDNIAVNFLPTTPLSLETTTELTVPPVVPLAGTDDPATAPPLSVPDEDGETSFFFDGGTFDYGAPIFGGAFGEFPSRLYSFTIPADGDYTITIDWEGGVEDLGGYIFLPDGTTEPGNAPADAGGEGAHPESATSTFTAGEYRLAVVNFSATNPPSFTIQLTREPPSGE